MSFRRLADFEPLSPAERTLVDGLDGGTFDRVDAGGVPEAGDPRRIVRADLLRFLIVGGLDAPRVHEKGVRVSGAWIDGTLDLEGCRIERDLGLADCRFGGRVVLRSAVLDTLFLDGSILPGLSAERLEARGDVNLRGTVVDGPVLMPGARIGGSLVADGATFRNPSGVAFEAELLHARGSLLLRGARLEGGLDLTNARLAGDLEAIGIEILREGHRAFDAEKLVASDLLLRRADVVGECVLDGARAGGDVDLSAGSFAAPGGIAFRFARGTIAGAFIMRDGARIDGLLGLNGATVGAIVDDPECWPPAGNLALNRCVYGGFLGAPVDADTRLRWLALQDPGRSGEDFWPQPHEQLAAVLGEMGHDEDAQRVLFEKERLQRKARRARAASPLLLGILCARDWLLRATVGYGRKAHLAFLWLTLLWLTGAVLLSLADEGEVIRPNVAVVLRSPEWILCGAPIGTDVALASLGAVRTGLAEPGESQLACWRRQPEAGSYPRFNALMFAVDTLLPALDTGQRDYWAPDVRFTLGWVAKWFSYFLTIAGWGLSLLAVAAFSGLVRSR